METQEVRQVVLDIIADIALDEDLSSIDDGVALREQLDLDSMDFLDIVMNNENFLKYTTKAQNQRCKRYT